MLHSQAGIIRLLPGMLQPFCLRMAYMFPISSWNPFGLTESAWSDECWPSDLWQGDEERGKRFANRRFTLAGCDISFSRHIGWYSKEGSLEWLRALHGFDWLRDVWAYNSQKSGMKLLRSFVEDWINDSNHLLAVAREPDVIGKRIVNWLIHARFILNGATPSFRRKFLQSTMRQAMVLRGMMRRKEGEATLDAIKGLLFASLCLPQCGFFYEEAIRRLQHTLLACWKWKIAAPVIMPSNCTLFCAV